VAIALECAQACLSVSKSARRESRVQSMPARWPRLKRRDKAKLKVEAGATDSCPQLRRSAPAFNRSLRPADGPVVRLWPQMSPFSQRTPRQRDRPRRSSGRQSLWGQRRPLGHVDIQAHDKPGRYGPSHGSSRCNSWPRPGRLREPGRMGCGQIGSVASCTAKMASTASSLK
jgi:hypothetical protein